MFVEFKWSCFPRVVLLSGTRCLFISSPSAEAALEFSSALLFWPQTDGAVRGCVKKSIPHMKTDRLVTFPAERKRKPFSVNEVVVITHQAFCGRRGAIAMATEKPSPQRGWKLTMNLYCVGVSWSRRPHPPSVVKSHATTFIRAAANDYQIQWISPCGPRAVKNNPVFVLSPGSVIVKSPMWQTPLHNATPAGPVMMFVSVVINVLPTDTQFTF